MVAPFGIPGEDCVGVSVPERVTGAPSAIEFEDSCRVIVDEPRKYAVSVCAEFMSTEYGVELPTFTPSRDQ